MACISCGGIHGYASEMGGNAVATVADEDADDAVWRLRGGFSINPSLSVDEVLPWSLAEAAPRSERPNRNAVATVFLGYFLGYFLELLLLVILLL
jgi:hypothetical protein